MKMSLTLGQSCEDEGSRRTPRACSWSRGERRNRSCRVPDSEGSTGGASSVLVRLGGASSAMSNGADAAVDSRQTNGSRGKVSVTNACCVCSTSDGTVSGRKSSSSWSGGSSCLTVTDSSESTVDAGASTAAAIASRRRAASGTGFHSVSGVVSRMGSGVETLRGFGWALGLRGGEPTRRVAPRVRRGGASFSRFSSSTSLRNDSRTRSA